MHKDGTAPGKNQRMLFNSRPARFSAAFPTSCLNLGSSRFSTSPLATWTILLAQRAILELFVKSSCEGENKLIEKP